LAASLYFFREKLLEPRKREISIFCLVLMPVEKIITKKETNKIQMYGSACFIIGAIIVFLSFCSNTASFNVLLVV